MFHSLISDQSPKAFQFPLLQLALLITFHLMFYNEKKNLRARRGLTQETFVIGKHLSQHSFCFRPSSTLEDESEPWSEGMNEAKKITVMRTTPKEDNCRN